MRCLLSLPLVLVPLLWLPLPCAASVLYAGGPSGFTVEYPREPLLLGSPFELVVRGPDLQSVHLGVEEHIGDVIVGRVTRRDVAGDGSEGRAEEGGGATKIVELRRPVSIAREGDYSLPLTVVDAQGQTTDLPDVEISVLLDVPDGHRSQVSDLLDPVAVPMPPASPWPFIAAALVGLVLLGWLVVAHGREKPVSVYHPPADRVAMEALADLRQHLPKTREEIRPFLIRVSDVLRVYIERVFQLHAPALTTEEFLSQAALRHDALSERRDSLAEFLQQCDLVKYAGERPAPSAAEPLLCTVETFVEETRGVVVEPEETIAITDTMKTQGGARAAVPARDEADGRSAGGAA